MLFFKRNNLFFVLFFVAQSLFAQQFPSANYSTLNGLANNSIYAIYKDSRDILWVGTANGLSAIQNGTVQNFYTTDGLAHNSCWAIAEDQKHNLWLGSYGGGLTFYDGKKFKIISTKNGLVNDKIRTLFIHQKHLFVGTEYGFSVIDMASKKVIYSDKIKGKKNLFQVMDFYLHNRKVHFATFSDGIWSIDESKKKIKLENHDIPNIFSVYPNGANLYISHIDFVNNLYNQLAVKNYRHQLLQSFATKTIFWDYTKDKRGVIYAAADGINLASGGVYKISEKGPIISSTELGLQSTKIWSLNYDTKKDLLYVGTLDKGLYEVDLKKQIDQYPPSYFKKQKIEVLQINNIDSTALILSKNELFFSKQNKIEKVIAKQKLYNFMQGYQFFKNKTWNVEYKLYYKNTPFINFELIDLKVMLGKIWVSTNLGLFQIAKNSEIIAYYPFLTKEFYFIDKDHLLYQQPYGTFGTIANFSKQLKVSAKNDVKKYDFRGGIQFIKVLDKPFILSNSSGLASFENNKIFSYAESGLWNEKELICGTTTSKNNLAIANSAGDIFIIEVGNKFKIIKKIPSSKLLGKSIAFLKSYKGYLIIGNEKGVVLYKDGEVRLINEEQGLTNKIISSAHLQGEMLNIGTNTGFYKLNLEKFLKHKVQNPDLKVTKIEVNYTSISNKNFNWFSYQSKNLNLHHSQNSLSINFEPYQALYPAKLIYKYKLVGMRNTNWSNWSNAKTINLTYLPPGKYQLLVELKDLHFNTTKAIELLTITIVPPFWESWWFFTISLTSAILLSYFLIKKRITTIKKQEQAKGEIQKRLVETKMEALQSQMNPHFIFNAMNSIQNFIINNDTDEALRYMGDFSTLIRQTLHNSAKIKISLAEEIDYLKTYTALEKLRFNNSLEVHINVAKTIDLSAIEIPPMLIQPFIENVFKHAFTSKTVQPQLILTFKEDIEYLHCEIKDNGKGIAIKKSNKLHQAKGIQLVKERLKLLQQDVNFALKISTGLGKGTVVRLQIKIH